MENRQEERHLNTQVLQLIYGTISREFEDQRALRLETLWHISQNVCAVNKKNENVFSLIELISVYIIIREIQQVPTLFQHQISSIDVRT